MDNAGIAAEAMSREDYLRDIIGQNRQQAQSLGSYASNLNRQTSVDPMAMLEVDRITQLKDSVKGPHYLVYHRNQ